MIFRRLNDTELFLLMKQSLNPLMSDTTPCRSDRPGRYESVRSQISNTSIEGECDDYLKAGGLLYTFVTLKDPPDATFPGILRELQSLGFPIVVNTEVVIPDQTKIIAQYRWQQRKMLAAQRDINGGFRVNVEAQVAERQLKLWMTSFPVR